MKVGVVDSEELAAAVLYNSHLCITACLIYFLHLVHDSGGVLVWV